MGADRPAIIFLMGPTAVGKSALAIDIARRVNAEIVSVDSAQVYRGLDIGTAKPSQALRAELPHRLIDVCEPSETYSAARFRSDALAAIQDIITRGNTPLLVGGTGLYFRALEYGLSALPPANAAIRARIEAEAHARGWPALHARLREIDPAAAARVHSNDPQRIQRALEVYELTGIPLTALQSKRQPEPFPFRVVKITVTLEDRVELGRRIESRFLRMLARGLVDEVERLYQRGDLHVGLPAVRAVGYRQLWEYLGGAVAYRDAVERAITATRQYAKRQMTWLRNEPNVMELRTEDTALLDKALKLIQ